MYYVLTGDITCTTFSQVISYVLRSHRWYHMYYILADYYS